MEEIDVDGLMNTIEAPQADIFPMTSETQETQAPETTQAPTVQELAFMANGKEIKVPYSDERLKQWAAMGHDYSQKMAEFNNHKTQFEQERKSIEALKEQYGPVDQYVKQNPDFWQHVLESWQQKAQNTDPSNPIHQKIQSLEQKLQEVDQFKNELTQEREAQKIQAEDTALDRDIQSIQEKYKNLDWKTADSTGKTLEYKVLEHAAQNGIKSFKTAFNDFYHDQLVKYETDRAKETAAKDIQKNTKQGLLGKQAPTQKFQKPSDVKGKSYEQLQKEALEELGIT